MDVSSFFFQFSVRIFLKSYLSRLGPVCSFLKTNMKYQGRKQSRTSPIQKDQRNGYQNHCIKIGQTQNSQENGDVNKLCFRVDFSQRKNPRITRLNPQRTKSKKWSPFRGTKHSAIYNSNLIRKMTSVLSAVFSLGYNFISRQFIFYFSFNSLFKLSNSRFIQQRISRPKSINSNIRSSETFHLSIGTNLHYHKDKPGAKEVRR